MTDWEQLREVGHEVSPPAFESLVTTAGKRTRRARIIAATATLSVLTGLGLGLGLVNDDGDGDGDFQPVKDPSQSVTIEEDSLPDGVFALPDSDPGEDVDHLDAGRYRVPLSDTLAVDIDLPQGAASHSNGKFISSGNVVLNIETTDQAYGVPRDPCTDQGAVAVGPTVEDLVEAIRNLPVFEVSRPEPVEVGGAQGQYFDLQVPKSYDASACSFGRVGLPKAYGDDHTVTPGYFGRWWILDVHGERVIVVPFCEPCPADATERITTMVQSITFAPTR
jgi:hypothetical protein